MSVYNNRGPVVRVVYLVIAVVYWMLTGFGRRRRVTLCYHGVTADQHQRFAEQMEWIARRERGRISVTFDDAFANLLDNALPVVRGLGIPTTVFAVTGNLGARPGWKIAADHPDAAEVTMTAEQVREAAAKRGVTFGSHGVTHRPLTGLSADEVRRELVESKSALEEIARRPVHDFAPPHGACDGALVDAAMAAGYRRVLTLGDAESGDGKVIGRMKMSPDVWPIEFKL
ncbi:MAG: polysaccharide deacetylase family protein, partial [Planctomycetota bacterium]